MMYKGATEETGNSYSNHMLATKDFQGADAHARRAIPSLNEDLAAATADAAKAKAFLSLFVRKRRDTAAAPG